MANVHGRDRACDGCHRIFAKETLEPVWVGDYMRMLCPDCLPHSKPQVLRFPDRPIFPVVDAVFKEAA